VDTSDSHRRIQLILWGVIALVALVAAILIATSGGEGGGLRFLGIGDAAEADGSSASAREIDQFLGEDGEPVVHQDSVGEFTELYGEPPNTDYARLRIPAIGVNAPVGRWIVDSSIMPDPYGPVDVAFYDLSAWSGLGGTPGEGHNAVFGGHVDMNRDVPYAGAHYRGPAVFWGLDQLTPGTIIEVDYAGETLRYAVVWMEDVSAASGTEWSQYWSNGVAVDSITLFTCGGEFDFESHSYSHRTVVRAERI
jgi:sortase (surface protein transpeptidase)